MRKNILIVTETPEFRILLESFLSGSFDVKVTGNNFEAISVIRNGYLPLLVLCDSLVPLSACIELIQSIKENSSDIHIPVLLMSGKDKSSEIADLIKAGASDYIYKPFRLTELENRIENLLKKNFVTA